MKLKTILLLSIVTIFLSCKGQTKDEKEAPKNQIFSIGELVSEFDDKIWTIYQDSKNNMWFGGNDKGVYKYDGERLILYAKKDGLISSNILGI